MSTSTCPEKNMNYRDLAVEFLQATATIVVLTFLFSIIGAAHEKPPIKAMIFALVFGGIPTMLAKRFILNCINRAQ
nr:hypothetical protein [Pseudomonas sp. s4]